MKYLSNKYPPPIAATCIGRSIKYTVPFNIDDITLYKSFPIGSISLITKFSTPLPKFSNVEPTLSNPDITPSFNVLISLSIAFATSIVLFSIFLASPTTAFSTYTNCLTKFDFKASSKVILVDLDGKS